MKTSLWKLQIIPLHNKTLVSGIVIKGSPKIHHEKDRQLSSFRKVVQAYSHIAYKHETITLEVNEKKISTKTRSNGEFKFELEGKFDAGIKLYDSEGKKELNLLQDYPVYFNILDSHCFVVTDIDDTILHSHSMNVFKKLNILLFRSPVKRKKVNATAEAFELLHNQHFQFIYLSRSEYNLFYLITSFIKVNKLPLAPIFLRKLTHWRSFFRDKGKALFKYAQLDEIVKDFPDKKFIFFGDDSQFDLDVYVHYAQLYPRSVLAIFIHRTKKRIRKKERDLKNMNALKNVHFYSEYEEIEKEIKKLKDEITTYR